MKRIIIAMFSFLVFYTPSVTAKEKLTWNISSKKVQKKVNIEQIYEESKFEIFFLPKNSIYQNEYDEYLLFEKDANGLIMRLQKTDVSSNDLLEKYRSQFYYSEPTSYEFYEIFKRGLPSSWIVATDQITQDNVYQCLAPFPDINSFEIQTMLRLQTILHNSRFSGKDAGKSGSLETCYIIGYEGNGYLLKEVNFGDFYKRNESKIDDITNKFTDCVINKKKSEIRAATTKELEEKRLQEEREAQSRKEREQREAEEQRQSAEKLANMKTYTMKYVHEHEKELGTAREEFYIENPRFGTLFDGVYKGSYCFLIQDSTDSSFIFISTRYYGLGDVLNNMRYGSPKIKRIHAIVGYTEPTGYCLVPLNLEWEE